jgi:DNA polymerase II large subunit
VTESEPSLPKHSIHYARYFAALNKEVKRIYAVAESARAKGVDPTTVVEIPPAYDVAARVEATLDGPVGVAKRIRELQKDKTRSREEVAFAVAKEIATGDLGGITDQALAILTESITAAPIEGISKVRIRGAGSDQYLAIYLAGPIRAAGGTEAAMTVLVADYVRQVLNLPAFKATEEEVERSLEEVELYARAVHLQYPVQLDLLRLAASKLPIMLTGEPTEEFEVSGSRDLERIETNRVRGGAVLVLNDGVVGRAAKLAKIVNGLEMPGWEWLNELAKKTSKAESSEDESTEKKLAPKSEYLVDVIGGRPVFSHPSRIGGFRLRYGRSRNTGLAGVGVHPATMFLADEFLAPGTHIRTERPGKGSIVSPVDTIEGPTVLLRDGTVKQVFTTEEACMLQDKTERIIFLGDILVALGEFLENNHPLVPSGYCEEWWSHDLDKARMKLKQSEVEQRLSDSDITASDLSEFINNPLSNIPSSEQALHLAMSFGVPLHPRYLYRWLALSAEETSDLRTWLLKNRGIERASKSSRIVIPNDARYKELLTRAGIPHSLNEDRSLICLTDSPATVLAQLGAKRKSPKGNNALEILNSCTKIELRDKMGFSIGARMGRPEKAEERKMKPPVHVLFPVGRALSSERRVERIAKSNEHTSTQCTFDADGTVMKPALGGSGVRLEMVSRICTGCGLETFESKCRECGSHTKVQSWCSHEECGRAVDTTKRFWKT